MFLKEGLFGSCLLIFEQHGYEVKDNSISFDFTTFYNYNTITSCEISSFKIEDNMYLTYNNFLVTNDHYFNSLSINESELILYNVKTNENDLKISKDNFKCLTIDTPNRDKLYNNEIKEDINQCLKYDFETYIKKRNSTKNTIYKQLIPNECYDPDYIEYLKDGLIEEICQKIKIKPEFIYKQIYVEDKLTTIDKIQEDIKNKNYNKYHIKLCCKRYSNYNYEKQNGLYLLNGQTNFDKYVNETMNRKLLYIKRRQ